MMSKPKSLYIHIPFCSSICSYCDFPKILYSTNYHEKYLLALKKEISGLKEHSFDTVYIGGGTPSVLSINELEDLLSFINAKFKINKEYSIECNPESLDEKKVELFCKYGVNRISLGVQTIDENHLKELNRHHTKEDVINSVKLLKKYGIDNINFDFIYGLDNESIENIKNNIAFACSLDVKHISYYALQIEKGTMLYNKYKGMVQNEDKLADYYSFICKELRKHGYYRYEVSNFSKKGFESKHNITYWRNKEYEACGLGATSYVSGVRNTRTRNITNYLEGKNLLVNSINEDILDQEFNYLMLNLRLTKGFTFSEYHRLFNKDFLNEYKNNFTKLNDDFIFSKNKIKTKPSKLYILDNILVDLLHFKDED